MKIDLTNYESWFLDYFEGNLSAEKVAELFLFLEQHPKLKEEFESFELITLEDTHLSDVYEEKESLKKKSAINSENINDWLIDELEGNLDLQQRSALLLFLNSHSQFKQDRELFQHTKINADTSIIFPAKEKLKKKIIVYSPTIQLWYAAASLILLIGAWLAFRLATNDQPSQTAEIKKNIPFVNGVKDSSVIEKSTNTINSLAQNKTEKATINKRIEEKNIAEKVSNKVANDLKREINDENNLALKNHSSPDKKGSTNFQDNVSEENSLQNHLNSNQQEKVESNSEIAMMTFINTPFLIEQNNYDLAVIISNSKINSDVESKNDNVTIANYQQKVVDNLKEFTAENVNKVIGEDLLATSTQPQKLSLKSRLLRFTGNTIGKLTNNRIKVKTVFDPLNGNLAAYELEVGKKVWQKQF